MKKYAAATVYFVDQNEPSVPEEELLSVDGELTDQQLLDTFNKSINMDVDMEEVHINRKPTYGDISVEYDDTTYLFITYVTLPA